MSQPQSEHRVSRFFAWIQNHRIYSFLVIAGIAIVYLATVTEAAQKLIAVIGLGSHVHAEESTGPDTAMSSQEKDLASANVLLAGVEGQSLAMRNNLKSDPALQALAASCLHVLSGRKALKPLHFDVINGKYKQLAAPEAAEGTYLTADKYGDMDKLRQAIVLHWNELYPANRVTNFEQIVK